MSRESLTTIHELDSRTNDGLHVRLLWGNRDGRLAVTVADTKTGEAFMLEVREGERPLDVFHHPYAYAEWHQIELGAAARSNDTAVATATLAA
jgi:hypothetical protein